MVIGGGHAGCEAAHAAARMGLRTAMVVLRADRIGFMSCNPAMGGLAKGQLIKEIDALGGIMGEITDQAAIQYRRLNSSKGPAVRSSRAQCDKDFYALSMRKKMESIQGLTVIEGEATGIETSEGRVSGVWIGSEKHSCKAAVITSGTFLRAVMHTGSEQSLGGRAGDRAAVSLSDWLVSVGFRLRRLKTGTPPRLHKDSIDWSLTEEQPGDENPIPFSFRRRPSQFPSLPQMSCHIVYTNEATHRVIEANFERSPMFTGVIQGIGPRYCPSIEDKVKRFREKERHQIFLEPEGLNTDEIYVNGISTSLPKDVQEAFVRTIPALKNAKFIRYGYAVEYDAIDSRGLKATLESKDVPGLFFAGQVNGTSGYEEAGAQGLIAGINAALAVWEEPAFVLGRHEGYIGVLIDDLVLKGADEPYRMFTSRAEHRLVLREDNADLRLTEKGYRLGLVSHEEFSAFERKKRQIQEVLGLLKEFYLYPGQKTDEWMTSRGQRVLKDRVSGEVFLRRPEIQLKDLFALGFSDLASWDAEALEQVEIQVKYQGYIERELASIEGVVANENLKLPVGLSFDAIGGLSAEVLGRVRETRPETLGQFSRMQGVTPAAVASVLIHLQMRKKHG
jgi:tRNA uridine 5-carboxymethylaminomethyl modification enzyme